MQKLFFFIIIFALAIECRFQEPVIATMSQEQDEVIFPDTINVDAYTLHKINTIIQDISNDKTLSQNEKISLISAKFLGTHYQKDMLNGSETISENLTIDFRWLDCITYLDYVIALHISHSENDFLNNIVKIRYLDSHISFYNRRHFFTDWANREHKIAEDITAQLSPKTLKSTKLLNQKNKDKKYLPGIPIVSRSITYIPSSAIDHSLISALKSGDLIGIYTPQPGLDVSHVGFVIITEQGPVFRHASSSKDNQSVVDSPLIPYLLSSPGIIVLRMKSSAL